MEDESPISALQGQKRVRGLLPMRIGVVLAHGRKLNENAVKFLILSLNRVQRTFEYEFLPPFPGTFLMELGSGRCLNREQTRGGLRLFFDRILVMLRLDD